MTNTPHPAEMTDEEREAHIKSCGQLLEQEYANGNREAALGWLQMMQQAIRARSPAKVQAMEQRHGLAAPCFFVEAGDAARAALMERQAV